MMRLPMFPLGTVLVPHEILPLHVFETRYRALVRDCLTGDGEFGIVLIERGNEVGGGDARFDIGCRAAIAQADELPDGRWELVVSGVAPIKVARWLPDDPYPQAEVEATDEEWSDAATVALAAARGAFEHVVDLARKLGGQVDPAVLDLTGNRELDHWALVSRAPVGTLDKHTLLCAPGPERRLGLLREQLDDLAAVLARRLAGG
jgi:Lon protease-like protein